MFFWWGAVVDLVLIVVVLSLGELARLSGRRLRMVLLRPAAFAFIALFIVLTFSAMFGLSPEDPYSAFRLAALFLLGWTAGAIVAVNVAILRRFAARSVGGVLKVSPFLERISELPAGALPDAPLGTPRAPIDVSTGLRVLTITIPVRRSGNTTARGLVFMAPAAVLLGRLVFLLVSSAASGMGAASVALVGSLGVVGNLLMNIPFWLAALWGAHLIFGEEVVTVEPHRLLVRKTVWGMGAPGGVLDVARSAVARPERNQSAQWVVIVEPEPVIAGVPRHVQFGAGSLSHDQAQELADVITKQFAETSGRGGAQCLTSASS